MKHSGPTLSPAQHQLLADGSRLLKEQLIERDGCECAWCQLPLSPETAVVSKILPGSHYKWLMDNLFLTCEACYRLRGGTTRGIGVWFHRCLASGLTPRSDILERGLLAMIEQCRGRHAVKKLRKQLGDLRSTVAPPPGIRSRRVKRMLERAAHQCVWCRRSLCLGDMYLSVEHLIPLGDGGRDIEANLLPACTPCNHQRGSCSIEEWIDHCLDSNKTVHFPAIEMSLRRQRKVASAETRACRELAQFQARYGRHLPEEQVIEIDRAECLLDSALGKSIFFDDRNFSIGYTREHAVLISRCTLGKKQEATFAPVGFFEGVLTPEAYEIHLAGSNHHSLTIDHTPAGITITFTDGREDGDTARRYFGTGTASGALLIEWCRKYQARDNTTREKVLATQEYNYRLPNENGDIIRFKEMLGSIDHASQSRACTTVEKN